MFLTIHGELLKIHCRLLFGRVGILEYIFEGLFKYSINLNTLNGCFDLGNEEVVSTLIQNGTDVNAADEHGETPLMNAAFGGDLALSHTHLNAT